MPKIAAALALLVLLLATCQGPVPDNAQAQQIEPTPTSSAESIAVQRELYQCKRVIWMQVIVNTFGETTVALECER